jgi:tetratricopeptide (TPR) repeat protein
MLLVDLDEAIRAQIIRERPTGYAFSHSLLRDGVYWALSRTRRMLLHGRAGDVLERLAGDNAMHMAPELAYHFSRAGQTAPIRRKALNYSLRAGRAAAALASHREALQHFDIACSLMEDPALGADTDMRVAALEGRGLAQGQQGMWQACIASYRQVLDLVSEPRARAEARQSISFALHHTVDIVGARLEAEAGLAELSGVEDRPDVAVVRLELQHQLAFLWFLEGRFRDVLQLGNEMVALAERLGEPRWLAWAHSVVGWGYMGAGRVPDALRHYELAVEAADRGGNKLDMADYRTNLGAQNYRGGRFDAAHEHLERAITIYREAASDLRSVYAQQLLGWVSIAEGNLNRAQEYADRAGALATEANDRWQADCVELNAALQCLRGDWRSARASLEQVLKMRQQVGHPAGIVDAFVALGQVAEAGEEIDAAVQAYREAVAISNSMEAGPGVVAAHRQLGLLLLRSGDAAGGAASITHAAELAEGLPESLEYAPTLLAQAELQLRSGDAEAGLAFAQRVFDAPHTAIVGIEADVLRAELLAVLGRPIEAQRAARTALRAAEQLGAPSPLRAAQRAANKAGVGSGNGQAAVTRHPRPAPVDR